MLSAGFKAYQWATFRGSSSYSVCTVQLVTDRRTDTILAPIGAFRLMTCSAFIVVIMWPTCVVNAREGFVRPSQRANRVNNLTAKSLSSLLCIEDDTSRRVTIMTADASVEAPQRRPGVTGMSYFFVIPKTLNVK